MDRANAAETGRIGRLSGTLSVAYSYDIGDVGHHDSLLYKVNRGCDWIPAPAGYACVLYYGCAIPDLHVHLPCCENLPDIARRRLVLSRLSVIGQGLWTSSGLSKLIRVEDASGLELWRMRINKGGRVLFEVAVEYDEQVNEIGSG